MAALALLLTSCDRELDAALDGSGGGGEGILDLGAGETAVPDIGKKKDQGKKKDGGKSQDGLIEDQGKIADRSKHDLARADLPSGDMKSPTACGSAPHPYSGSLCGPSGSACKVKINEKIPTTAGFRNRQPALALDKKGLPRVLFSLAVGGYTGYWAVRGATGVWSVAKTPFALAMGGLDREPSGSYLALAHAGDTKGGELWRHNGKAWAKVQTVNPSLAGYAKGISGWPHGLEVDSGGCAHMGIYDVYKSEAYLRRGAAGKWFSQSVATSASGTDMSIALSPGGLAHVVDWASAGSAGWELKWQVPGVAKVEKVMPLGSNTLSEKAIGLAVTGAKGVGVPHLFFSAQHASVANLIYARRGTAGWVQSTLVTGGSHSCGKCTAGAKCSYDYSTYHPMSLVASGGGDVRLLYARKRYHGTKVGTQQSYPPFNCFWSGGQVDGSVHMAWPATGGFKTALLISKIFLNWGGTVETELDASGNIHAAIYSSTTGLTNTDVRYLKIGK